MAKKKKKKKGNRVQTMGWGSSFKPDKGTKPDKASERAYKKIKHVDRSLDKKERKDIDKIANKVPKVDPKVLEIRAKCNHATDTITVDEFKSMANPHITPLLDLYEDCFNESEIAICKDCKEALLDRSILTPENLKVAAATMIGTIGYVVSHLKMSKKELKSHNAMKNDIFDILITLQDELDKAIRRDEEYEAYERSRNAAWADKHNKGGNSVVNLGNNQGGFTREDDDDE